MIAFYAVLKAGATVVNYSPLDAAKVLKHKIEDSETDFLITLDLTTLYPQMAALLGKTRLKRLIVSSFGDYAGSPSETTMRMAAEGQLADVAVDDSTLSFAELLANDGQLKPCPVADPSTAIAVLQYTGGTTGLPKGAMLTHGNLVAACAQLWESLNGSPRVLIEGEERFLAVLPAFHIYSLTVNVLLGIRAGAELILHTRFDLATVLKEVSEQKVTALPGVPTMFTALVNHPGVDQLDLSSLRFCLSGGAPLPLEVAERFSRVAGCPLREGWGMTETSPTGTFTPKPGPAKPGSCGMPMPRIAIKMLDLVDPTRYAEVGERGEMCISGPNVMRGYWKNPEATAAMTTFDGFLRTGDVAHMDKDGYITIVDRTKDMLLCGGFNVYPRILEEAIYEHPSVEEVSVIGIEDEYRGQSPKAFVKLKVGAAPFTLDQLQTFLKSRLGRHEMVQALDIRAELPKTAVGKLSKKELMDEETQKRSRIQ